VVEKGVVPDVISSALLGTQARHEIDRNAGGSHNLLLAITGLDLPQLMKEMGAGSAQTELNGTVHQHGERAIIRAAPRVLDRKRPIALSGSGNHHWPAT